MLHVLPRGQFISCLATSCTYSESDDWGKSLSFFPSPPIFLLSVSWSSVLRTDFELSELESDWMVIQMSSFLLVHQHFHFGQPDNSSLRGR